MASLSTISRLSAIMTLDVTRFMTNSERVSAKLKTLRREAVAFGQGFSRTFSLAFGLVAAGAIKTAAGFDQLQAQLQAVTGGRGLGTLESQARELGRTTVFTATQVANLQLELSKLGFGTAQVTSGVQAATRITAVFGGDLVKTGTTIAEAVRQFSNSNLDATRVADVMAVAFKETALSTDNFGQAMKNVGSVANITGNDFESTVALLGLLANAGQKGGIAGTRLKGVMIRLGKQFGVTGEELNLLTSGQLDFNQLIEIFRNRAGVAAAVISELGDEFEVLKQKLLDSRGAAAAMESALSDRLFFSLKRIEAATESVGLSIGEAFTPTMAGLANAFADFAEYLESADKGTIRMVVSIGTFLAVLPIVVFLVTQIGTALAATFLSAPGIILSTVAAFVALGIAAKVQLGQTVGVLKDSRESVIEFAQGLEKAAEEGVVVLTKQVEILNEELDKIAADDRLGTVDKIEATQKLTQALEKTNEELAGLEDFGTQVFQTAFNNFTKVAVRNTRRIAENAKELEDVQERIANTAGYLVMGAPEAFGSRVAIQRQERILQSLENREMELILDTQFNQSQIDAYLDIVKTSIDDLDLSLFTPEQLQAQATQIEQDIKRIAEATATAQAQRLTPIQNFFTNFGERFNYDNRSTLRFFNALLANEKERAAIVDEAARDQAEMFRNRLNETNITATLVELDKQRVVQQLLLNRLQKEIAQRQEEQLRKAREASNLATGYSDIFLNESAAKESIEAFDKLKEALKNAVSSFGVASGSVQNVEKDLSELARTSFTLLETLNTKGTNIPELLGDNFAAGQGTLEDRKKAIDEIVKGIDAFVASQGEALRFDLAAIFERANVNYKKLQASLERRLKLKSIADASDEALELNEYLASQDLIDRVGFLRAEMSRLNQRISDTKKAGGVVNKDDINLLKLYEAELEALSETISSRNFVLDFGLEDPRLLSRVDVLNKRIQLLGSDSSAAIEELTKRFNGLKDKLDIVDDSFNLTDGNALISLEQVDAAILKNLSSLDRLTATTEEYKKVQSKDKELRNFRDLLVETYRILGLNAEGIENLTEKLQALQDEQSFRDSLLELETLSDKLGLGFITPLEEATQRLGILRDAFLEAYNNPAVLKGSGYTLKTLGEQVVAAEELTMQLEKYANLQQFVSQQVQFIGDAFIAAAKDGENFFEVLRQGFLNTFYALIGKLITLIALFAVLNILTNGAFMAGGSANTNFAQFLGQGFGISGGGTQSSNVGSILNLLDRNLAVEGSISGNNIVLANQRGTRAIDRTFG